MTMLTDVLIELRRHQDASPEFTLAEVGRKNTDGDAYVLHSYRVPVTFNHTGGSKVEVTANVTIAAGLWGHPEARRHARELSMKFVGDRLPNGYSIVDPNTNDRMHDDGMFVVQGQVSLDEAKAEIDAINAPETRAERLVGARYKAGASYVTYPAFLEGPARPMGLAAIRKASQQGS
jgi:hypothetical protein